LIVALPRPKALRRLLQTAACFGVDHIELVNAWRVDKSYWGSPQVAAEAMEEELWLGCEQGRHPWLPTISTQRLLVPFLEGLGSGADELRLLAHPGTERWLDTGDAGASSCVIAIGPEGGWIEAELASFAEAGFTRFALSESILRSEIAIAATLAQLELLASR
jgi:RsmE family RNA methyltransferase